MAVQRDGRLLATFAKVLLETFVGFPYFSAVNVVLLLLVFFSAHMMMLIRAGRSSPSFVGMGPFKLSCIPKTAILWSVLLDVVAILSPHRVSADVFGLYKEGGKGKIMRLGVLSGRWKV